MGGQYGLNRSPEKAQPFTSQCLPNGVARAQARRSLRNKFRDLGLPRLSLFRLAVVEGPQADPSMQEMVG